MKLFALLLILSFIILAKTDEKDQKIKPRIAGGFRAKPYTILYIVGIVLSESCHSKLEFGAGTIIGSQWVLTVATLCKYKYVEVHIGSRRGWEGFEISRVYKENYFIHPNKKHDVALLKCPHMKWDNRMIRIRVPNAKTWSDRHVDNLTISCGWGAEKRHGPLQNWLRCMVVRIISNEECAKDYPPLASWQMCTSGLGGKGICEGDLGGPVVGITTVKPVVLGMMDLSPDDCAVNSSQPSIHIRVSDHLKWIYKVSYIEWY
ncbi:serine protease 1-like [Drosophila ficusphila]|uniref:serine protease 1-like n=1 Tax=Drosophila ficusphila TaxID=30025 RepID=UPI0007E6314D|nr:serine protease 1-like [Drosophila ficusphila]